MAVVANVEVVVANVGVVVVAKVEMVAVAYVDVIAVAKVDMVVVADVEVVVGKARRLVVVADVEVVVGKAIRLVHCLSGSDLDLNNGLKFKVGESVESRWHIGMSSGSGSEGQRFEFWRRQSN